MILLDTSFLIRALKPSTPQNQQLREWIGGGEGVGISMMAWAEFLCGPVTNEDSEAAADLLSTPEPLLQEDAVLGADLFNVGGRRRGSLCDCLIAATCMRLGARLATANHDDFRRYEPQGLRLV